MRCSNMPLPCFVMSCTMAVKIFDIFPPYDAAISKLSIDTKLNLNSIL